MGYEATGRRRRDGFALGFDKAGIQQTPDAFDDRLIVQPERPAQLTEMHFGLVADQRKHHEVTDGDRMLLNNAGQRILGLAEAIQRFFAD